MVTAINPNPKPKATAAKAVTLTLLLVSRNPGGTVAVAQLASPSGKTLTRYCLAVTEPGRRPLPADVTEAMQQAAEAATQAGADDGAGEGQLQTLLRLQPGSAE